MIPSTPQQLREHVRGWPVADVWAAVAKALPTVDSMTVALVAQWLVSEAPVAQPPLGQGQVEAIWLGIQRRVHSGRT